MKRSALLIVLLGCLIRVAGAEQWPRFRGPSGQGVSQEHDLPLHWSKTENVAWKAAIPGTGWSSPIVWDNRIFLTSTTDEGGVCHVICLDRDSGKIVWDQEVFRQKPTRKERKNSYSTPTPVTDGTSVFAVFGEGGVVALSFDGKVIWTNTENAYYSQHGMGASPILYKDMLIVPFDWSSPTGEPRVGWQIPWDKSFVLALDKASGRTRYKAGRGQSRIGHCTPQVVEVDGKPQLVSGAGDVIEGFDPDNGERLWWAYNGGEAVVPSPVIGDGMVFTSSGFPTQYGSRTIYAGIRAFKLGGVGDMSETNLVWEEKKAVPMVPSYAFADHLLFTVKEDGIAQCFEAATGKLLWKHRLEGTYSASPIVAEGKAYELSDAGTTTVFEVGREYKELAVNELEGPCQASPAVSKGHIFIRAGGDLLSIGSGAK